MNNNRISFFLLGATLALGLGWSAHLIGSALVKMRQDNLIRVKGVAENIIDSDIATWGCGYTVRNVDLKSAYSELEVAKETVIDFLIKNGIAKESIDINNIGIRKIMKKNEKGDHDTNIIEFYELSQSLKVELNDVQKIKSISSLINDLVKSGIEINSDTPRFLYSKLESLKLDLLGKATKNAYERAQIIADNGGGKIHNLSSASQGIFQITAVNSTETSDEGAYNTASIKKSVKCVVTLDFNLGK
jgi:uncharacterized protein